MQQTDWINIAIAPVMLIFRIVFSMKFCPTARLALSFLLSLSYSVVEAAEPVDLTYPFDDKTIYWPTSKGFEWKLVQHGITPGGYFYSSADYAANEHGGTHLDAPVHFRQDGLSVDRIPVAKLMGPLVVVDVSAACARNPDYRVSAADFIAWETQHGRIPDGAIVLIRTGWGKHWPDKKRYLGTDKPGDVAGLHFPGISVAGTCFLSGRRAQSKQQRVFRARPPIHIGHVHFANSAVDSSSCQGFDSLLCVILFTCLALRLFFHVDFSRTRISRLLPNADRTRRSAEATCAK
ncbi:MAG TPA: cyclase family protein [Bryobacteraceae bacterium]|jgi:kynurenine formamidase